MDAWTAMQSVVWAIQPEWLHTIAAIANRETDIELVQSKLGRPLDNARTVSVRDGVAIVPVTGPIFRYANLFTAISGATSIDTIARDFRTALEDPAIHSIILEINSPGGDAKGVSELAQFIYTSREKKPIVAYADGYMCSAGYWIGAAAGEVWAESTSVIGSIGAIMTTYSGSGRDSSQIEFVSSNARNKSPDAKTEAGASVIQARVDALASVFEDAVAHYRGIPREEIGSRANFGDVLIGAAAVRAGLADRLGTMEILVSELTARHAQESRRPLHRAAVGGTRMSKESDAQLNHEELSAKHAELEKQHQAQMATMQAQMAAMQNQLISTQAAAFIQTLSGEARLTPAEVGHMQALYVQLATDDAAHPLETGSRINALSTLMQARPTHVVAGQKVPAGAAALVVPSSIGSQDQPVDKEARLAALRGKTSMGRKLNERQQRDRK